MSLPISVLILTKNEQQDLPGCLESVAWSDDIHLFDSFSTDGTLEIARSAGATITQRAFDNWAAHQNCAVQNLAFKYPWVFYIDADERVTDDLRLSMESAIRAPRNIVAFQIQRRDFFAGTWLKHCQATPYYLRLFRPEKMRYERPMHVVSVPDGPVERISGYLDHFPFSKGLSHWLDRHNAYSTGEARLIVENRRASRAFSLKAAFLSKDFHEKRVHQKELFYRLPCRPVLKFCLLYGLKRGFLDGRAGLTYSMLQSIYEYMIVLKTRELEERYRLESRPVPDANV